jgi:outer membrane lipoprotein-sorting protein
MNALKRLALGAALALLSLTVCQAAPVQKQTNKQANKQGNKQAEAVLQRSAAAYKKATALQADLSGAMTAGGQSQALEMKLRLKRPNLLRVEMGDPQPMEVVSDGTNMWMLMKSRDQYTKSAADPTGRSLAPFPIISAFYARSADELKTTLFGDAKSPVRYLGKKSADGTTYDVLEATRSAQGAGSMTTTVHVAPSGLAERVSVASKSGDHQQTMTMVLKNVKLNPPLTVADFKFNPPQTARLMDPNAGMEAGLVAVGAEAPKFTIPDPNGGEVSLENTLKDKKAVLVNFWFYN